jgi:hypothetical protein
VIPDTLNGWTLPKIEDIARAGVSENDVFDLKADLQSPDHQRKTVAAFANSDGGFLVFGVTNDRRVVGVTNPELVRDFGGKLRDNLSPSVEFRFAEKPHTLPSGNLVYVAHVPKGTRAPHAVYINNAWGFFKRTAAGSNEPMTYEEIRAAFTDARRRLRELMWLQVDVERIRSLAENMHPNAPGVDPLTRLATRFDLGQLKAIRLSLFDDIGRDPLLVSWLDRLETHCANVNEVLAPLAAFAVLPRDRSYSGGGVDGLGFATKEAERIAVAARSALTRLEAIKR